MTRQVINLVIVATVLVLSPGESNGQTPGTSPVVQPASSPEQRLSDVLKDVINKGADLYNPPTRDHNACYRLFQGALMVARIQLDNNPELKKEIEAALSEAERLGQDGQRAFTLRRALDRIRTTIGQKTPSAKPPDAKPEDKKVPPPLSSVPP